MRRWLLVVATMASVAGCDGCAQANPPAPVIPLELPPEAFEGFARTDGGKPILATAPFGEIDLHLVYDPTLDDPLARWAHCLDRVTACYQTNGGTLGGCVDLIEVCPGEAGGHGCCPPACIADYKEQRRSKDERAAIEASFLAGHCIPGYREQISVLEDVQP